jgi:hypothetical protein
VTEYENGNDENGLGADEEKKDFACACNSSSVGTAGVFGGGGFDERSSLKVKCESSGSSSQVCWRGNSRVQPGPRVLGRTTDSPVRPGPKSKRLRTLSREFLSP